MMRPVLALALLLATTVIDAQQPTFSSRREIVRVDALVTSGGKLVRDLKAADFTVLDSGVAQQVDLVSFETLPLSVMFVFDGSASVKGERLERLREAGRAALAELKPEDQAGLLTFGRAVDSRQPLTHTVSRVRDAIETLEAERSESAGGTTLIDACYAALVQADADPGRTLMIVFTDGVDTSSWLAPERVLDAARRSNVVAYGVTTGSAGKGSFLREFSEQTGGSSFEIAGPAELRAAFLRILDEFRQRYVLSFTPVNVPAAGWHPLTVRVRGRNLTVRARAGYAR